MIEPTSEQVEQLTRAFERFTRRFKVAEAAAAADNALNALDAQTLLFVSEHPGCGLGDVARDLGVAPREQEMVAHADRTGDLAARLVVAARGLVRSAVHLHAVLRVRPTP